MNYLSKHRDDLHFEKYDDEQQDLAMMYTYQYEHGLDDDYYSYSIYYINKKAVIDFFNGPGNKYFDNNKVWDLLSLNPSKCKDVIYNCIQIIVNLSNLLYPFMPNTCKKIKQSLDLKDGIWSFTEKKEGIIRECDILFTKIDKKRASEEVARLKENKI